MNGLLTSVLLQYWQPLLALFVGYGLNYAIQKRVVTPEQVAQYDDYLALAIDFGVHIAEKSGLPGADKLELAKQVISQQLIQAGFAGLDSEVGYERVLKDIEYSVNRYFHNQ